MDVNIPQWLYADPVPEKFLKESVEKTPEMLVFGAELKCTQGTQNGFLMVLDDSICINGLPQANVGDRIISDNIVPFGVCQQGAPCQQIAKLQKEWMNPNPQKSTVRGKEAITTESFLLCDRCGEISAVNSGQDGLEAVRIFSEWELIEEIEEKYPGLIDILLDPYGSLYLTEGMYQKALQFLGDCVAKNGGEIEIIHLGSPNTLEGILMNRALGHLVVEFDASTEAWRHNQMTQIGVNMGFEGIPEWNVDVLNEDMLGFLKEICEKCAEDVATNPNYRVNESTKELGTNLYEAANTAFYIYIASQYRMKAQQEKAVDFEEKGFTDELNKTKQKLKGVADKLRNSNQVGANYKRYSVFTAGMSPEDAERYIANNEKAFCQEFSERAAKVGLNNEQISEAYKAMRSGDYKKMASYFDTSSPVNGAVFWSGDKEAASIYAKEMEGTILEQTAGGQMFDNWRGLQGMYPKWDEFTTMDQRPIWEALSTQYAEGAEGIATYVHPMGRVGEIWSTVEEPILKINGIEIKEVIIYGK